MDQTSTPLALNESEVDLSGLALSPSIKIKTPGLEAALIRFEVILEQVIPLFDYEQEKEEADFVIVRVVASVMDDIVYDQDKQYVLIDQLKPVARGAGSGYCGIKTLTFKRQF